MTSDHMKKALKRYEIIAPYLHADLVRGQHGPFLKQLAERSWTDESGNLITLSIATLRRWIRQYKRYGLDGLQDSDRAQKGASSLSFEVIEKACMLKREVPERSIQKIIMILEGLHGVPVGTVAKSTLHRVLKSKGLSGRTVRTPDRTDLDRFEAPYPNALWQSDMLVGPWLPDPDNLGKSKRTYLYLFIDDHSRLILSGRFAFKGDLPALSLVFRHAIQIWGLPKRCYYDNGKTYRSKHMAEIVARLGIRGIVHTKPYRPMGHGKIEALNRYVRKSFLSELKVSSIRTLGELNEAFTAWATNHYNQRVHSEIKTTPKKKWRAGMDKVTFADDKAIAEAFLWAEHRKTDKSGVFSLIGQRYQVGSNLANRKVEIKYDPEALHEVEIYLKGVFQQRARPLEIHPWRRQKPLGDSDEPTILTPSEGTDWLGHLVSESEGETSICPKPQDQHKNREAARTKNTQVLLKRMRAYIPLETFDALCAENWLDTHGPFDEGVFEEVLRRIIEDHDSNMHTVYYLEQLLGQLR